MSIRGPKGEQSRRGGLVVEFCKESERANPNEVGFWEAAAVSTEMGTNDTTERFGCPADSTAMGTNDTTVSIWLPGC